MTRPRILIVAPSAELYGSDRALLSALPELIGACDVTLAVPAMGPAVERARAMGAEVVELPDYAIRRRHLRPLAMLPWFVRILRAIAMLHRLHRARRFDLVYSNTLAAGIGPVLHVMWRVPHLLHVHECPTGPAWFIKALLLTARLSDRVVCNSAFSRSFVVAREPKLTDRSVVIHNGIELPEPAPAPPPSDALRVSCVGRIHPKKGHHILLEAASRLIAEGQPVELHLYGDNLPEHAALRDGLDQLIIDNDLGDAVTWHGFVDDTAAMYRDHDVAVVPSMVPEEFSLVCVEAQAMCLPVIATGPGGPSEVIVDGVTGIIVPPADPDALSRALAELAGDPDRRREMGRKGRERMVAVFSRAPFGEQMRDICLRTAGNVHGTPVPAS